MDANTEINRVAIVGTDLIGSSWAACFLAHGLDVVATDPAPGTEDEVRQYVEAAWAALTKNVLFQRDGIKPQYLKGVETTKSYGPKTRRLNI